MVKYHGPEYIVGSYWGCKPSKKVEKNGPLLWCHWLSMLFGLQEPFQFIMLLFGHTVILTAFIEKKQKC